MESVKIEVFFSCSFLDSDKDVNDYFLSICKGLDLRCSNVSTGYAETPPEAAKKMINNSQALIAICTKRGDLGGGNFIMPDSVHDELSFAFGKDIPVLMLVEDGVQLAGFKTNFGTYLRFRRDALPSAALLEKSVSAIHNLKMYTVSTNDLSFEQALKEFYAEYIHHLVELKEQNGGYLWVYSSSKKIVFCKPYKKPIVAEAWAVMPQILPDNPPQITWELTVDNSSRGITIKSEIEKQTAECVKALLRLEPTPEDGDYIEYSLNCSSPYLNPVWLEDVSEHSIIHLDVGDYRCADGLVPIHRTKKAIVEFRFPKSYGLKERDIHPFVACYTSSVDYEVKSELERVKIETDFFAGNLIVRLRIDSPLIRYMYGIAWNPQPKKT